MRHSIFPDSGRGGRTAPAARWVFAALLGLISTTALGAAHPYERWAEELGIDMDVSYDGTRVMQIEDGSIEMTERRAPGKLYTEVHMASMTAGVIIREDLKKSFILMPSMGFYREDSLEGGLTQTSNGLEFAEVEEAGRESVNGHPSTKYNTRFSDNNGEGAGSVWVTDTGVPIKMDLIYSGGGVEGQRLAMEFTELNLRPQDPQHFEVPDNLRPMTMGNMPGLGELLNPQQATPPTAAADSGSSGNEEAALAAAQQKCLQDTMQAAQDGQKTKRGFGRLLSAASRVTKRLGGPDLSQTTSDVYEADATAADISAAAEDLGITEDDVERCKNP